MNENANSINCLINFNSLVKLLNCIKPYLQCTCLLNLKMHSSYAAINQWVNQSAIILVNMYVCLYILYVYSFISSFPFAHPLTFCRLQSCSACTDRHCWHWQTTHPHASHVNQSFAQSVSKLRKPQSPSEWNIIPHTHLHPLINCN